MKKKIFTLLLCMILLLTGCSADTATEMDSADQISLFDIAEQVSLFRTADFCDNYDAAQLSVEGKIFSIDPDTVKTYSWKSDGVWMSGYVMTLLEQ